MAKIQVFDPAMCCATGVCGVDVDPALARFAADVEWLKTKGVEVERFNLSQQPAAFVANAEVAAALHGHPDALPLVVAEGKIVFQGDYPDRRALAELAGIPMQESICSEAVLELVALGAAIASNCEPCFRFHFDKARKLGVSRDDMARAVATARAVKEAPARAVLDVAAKYLGQTVASTSAGNACCAPTSSGPGGNGATASADKCC